jgi:hypothetical protein
MLRRLFTLLSALSMLLCVATAALWVRSYWTVDVVERCQAKAVRGQWLTSVYGKLYFGAMRASGGVRGYFLHGDGISYAAYGHARRPLGDGRHILGFSFGSETKTPPDYHFAFGVPYWFLLSLAAAMPGIRGVRFRRRRACAPGVCTTCGYDLRATPGRCPECGTETKNPAASAGGDKRTA